MHARLLDVLHDAADQHVLAVAAGVDVDFDGDIEETVEQHGAVVRHADGGRHVGAQIVLVEHDFHRAAAEHVRRTHDERKAHRARERHRLLLGARRGIRGLLEAEILDQHLEALAVLGDVDRVGRRADDRRAGRFERARQLQRRLSAVLHDDAFRLFLGDDLEHVLERERLEVQAIGRVVVGRHGFRIAIDHDGFETILAQLQRGMHAAVVELDALADAVRTAAEDHDLALLRRLRLALFLVGRVHVGRRGGELRRAGIDALVDRAHVERVPLRANRRFAACP